MAHLLLPSVVCTVVPSALISMRLIGEVENMPAARTVHTQSPGRDRNLVFAIGLLSLIFVPVFKSITHLPPYIGILGTLGLMWMITELIHSGKDERDKDRFSVLYAL